MKTYVLANYRGIFAWSITALSLFISMERVAFGDEPVLSAEVETCEMMTVCTGNYIPDPKECYCACGITSCADPEETFDPATCSCKKEPEPNPACKDVTCAEGQVLNLESCQCTN